MHPKNAAALGQAGPGVSLGTDASDASTQAVEAFDQGAFIDNGFVQLGVNPQGHLNVDGGPPSNGEGQDIVGLRWMLTNNDAISPGCQCEGWGVADDVSNVAGWASGSEGIAPNLEVVDFVSTSDVALSLVQVKNPAGEAVLQVRHLYEPVLDNPYLYQALVTITNLSDQPVEALYRRVMDWDVEPTAFEEWVTLVGDPAQEPWLAGMTNDGFAHPNPLEPRTDLGKVGPAQDYPFPDEAFDHGALFDLDFGTLAPESLIAFTIYYGVAGNEGDALAALDKVGTRVYSLGQPALGRETGLPNTFMFGFGRPLSCGQEDFGRDEVRSDMTNRAGKTEVVVHYDARTLVDPRTGNWELAAPEVAKAVMHQAEAAFDRYKALNFAIPGLMDIEITCNMFFRIPGIGDVPPETAGLVEAESKMKLRTSVMEDAFRRAVLTWDPADPFVPPVAFWQELINHEAFHAVQIATTGEIDRGLDFANGDRTRIESSAVAAQELDPAWDDVASDYAGRAGGLLGNRTPADLKDQSAIDHEGAGFGAPYNAGLIFQYWAERFEPIRDPDLEKRLAIFLNRLISAPGDRILSYRFALLQDPFDALREFFIAAYVRDFPNVALEQPQYVFLDEDRDEDGDPGGRDLPALAIAPDLQNDLAGGPVAFMNQELQDGQGAVYQVDLPAGADQVRVSLDHLAGGLATPVRLAFLPLDLNPDDSPFRVTVRRDLMTFGPNAGFTKPTLVPVFGKERIAVVVVASEQDARYNLRIELANRGPIQILSPTTAVPLRIQEGRQASVDLVVSPSINGVVPPGLGPQHFFVQIGGRQSTVQRAEFNTDRYTLSVLVEPGLAVGAHDVRVTFGGVDTVLNGLVVTAAPQPRPREQSAASSLGTLLPGQTASADATVSAGADDATFALDWLGSDVDLTLRAPSGRVITESTIAADVTVAHGADFVTITVTNPEAGEWRLEAFGAVLPPGGEPVTYAVTEPNVPIRSDLRAVNAGGAGTPIAISMAVGSPAGGVADATVTAVVTDPTGGVRTYPLTDRGTADDTSANDGTYTALAWSTPIAGTYHVRVDASGVDATGEPWTRVEAADVVVGAKVDTDGDGLANGAETRFGLNPNNPADAAADLDGDGLSWLGEANASTDPYVADTDYGNEIDGTEVAAGRDPLDADDDVQLPALVFGGRAVDGRLVQLQVDTWDRSGLVVVDRIGPAGTVRIGTFAPGDTVVTDGPLAAGTYHYDAYVEMPGGARSAKVRIGPFDVADDATDPHGTLVLNDGSWQTTSREVTARLVDLTEPIVSMRIALSESALSTTPWVPFEESTTVVLAAQLGDQVVYAQLRDAAGRESLVLTDVIELTLLDTTAPVSMAGPLPATTSDPALAVPYTASDAGSGVFIVELWQRQRPNLTAPWGSWALVRSGTQSPLLANVTTAGEYEFYTVAIDEAGNREAAPSTADTSTRYLLEAPPTAPGNPVATAAAWNRINLTWVASTDDVGVIRYEISRGGTLLSVVSGTTTSFTDWSVSPLTSYSYTVRAFDEAGNGSAASTAASATTPAYSPPPDTVAPSAPPSVSATQTNQQSSPFATVNVFWTRSTDNVEVTSYTILRNGVCAGDRQRRQRPGTGRPDLRRPIGEPRQHVYVHGPGP